MPNAGRIKEIIMDCLHTQEELQMYPPSTVPEGCIVVHSVILHIGFHPQRLESHRAEVKAMLLELPDPFMRSKGGGWSFLNACNDKEGKQWGEHRDIDGLLALGVGLGYVKFLMPRGMWGAFPGGVPYFSVDDTRDEDLERAKQAEVMDEPRIR
jgi:hypothetical protein